MGEREICCFFYKKQRRDSSIYEYWKEEGSVNIREMGLQSNEAQAAQGILVFGNTEYGVGMGSVIKEKGHLIEYVK